MTARRGGLLLLILALLGIYGARAVVGVRAGWELDRGHLLRNKSDYRGAAPRLEQAAVGFNGLRALLMAADARLDQWEKQLRRRGALGTDPEELVQAAADYLTCRCLAPASGRSWEGLGEIYDAIERIARERRSEEGWVAPEEPWARVGRSGRIAIGLLRHSVAASPNWSPSHDTLALTLWNYGLENEAREAVRSSAQALPIYHRHPYFKYSALPPWVDLEFAAASRAVLGQVPLFPRTAHLIDLGKLERQLGAYDRAIPTLEEALAAGGDAIRVAEASFHLGLALIAVERHEEGRERLVATLGHPVFRASALRNLAALAVRLDDRPAALEYLRQLRREQPGDLDTCLDFARVAAQIQDWPAALEALQWAKLKHGRDPRPYLDLARIHITRGDLSGAAMIADELEEAIGADAPEAQGLRLEIGARGHGARPTR